MKVFVTGHKGYIGAHLVALLKECGDTVTGCDLDVFAGCEWEQLVQADHEIVKDIRNVSAKDLEGYDCIMHLAAISNDPMGDLDTDLTYSVNRDGSMRLAELAKQVGVQKFLFSSSCSIYGKGEKLDLDESAISNPVSAYAIAKIDVEKKLVEMSDETFSTVSLRNSTAYGHSPMLRIDLVVNNLLGCAFARGDIRIMSDGTPWRPLIHCKDIARAFIAFMNRPKGEDNNIAVNIGSNSENYQVKDVADKVKKLIPKADIVFTGEVGNDPRNYRVNFDYLYELLPDFKLEYNLDTGMEELHRKYLEHSFNIDDFEGERFVRLRTIKNRMHLFNRGNNA